MYLFCFGSLHSSEFYKEKEGCVQHVLACVAHTCILTFCLCVWQVSACALIYTDKGVCSCAHGAPLLGSVCAKICGNGLCMCLDTGICFTAGVGVIF